MSWGRQLHEEMEVARHNFGVNCAGAGFALGIIGGIAIGWLLFGGGA